MRHETGAGDVEEQVPGAGWYDDGTGQTRWWDGADVTNREWTVDVPGGRLTVTFTEAGTAELAGPAVLVADGTWTEGPGSGSVSL